MKITKPVILMILFLTGPSRLVSKHL